MAGTLFDAGHHQWEVKRDRCLASQRREGPVAQVVVECPEFPVTEVDIGQWYVRGSSSVDPSRDTHVVEPRFPPPMGRGFLTTKRSAGRRDSTPGVRNPHAGQPFTTTDEEIAEALLDVSIPTLMLSLVHMSGDPSLIRGELKPAGLFLNEVQGYMSEEDKAAVRKIALEVIADYRDRGCPEPEPIGAELLHEMMQWLVCEPVPDEYVPMLLEEMELDGRGARATALSILRHATSSLC